MDKNVKLSIVKKNYRKYGKLCRIVVNFIQFFFLYSRLYFFVFEDFDVILNGNNRCRGNKSWKLIKVLSYSLFNIIIFVKIIIVYCIYFQ